MIVQWTTIKLILEVGAMGFFDEGSKNLAIEWIRLEAELIDMTHAMELMQKNLMLTLPSSRRYAPIIHFCTDTYTLGHNVVVTPLRLILLSYL